MDSSDSDKVEVFSFQMKGMDEDVTLKESYLRARFSIVEVLNLVAAGKIELDNETKKSIRVYNRYCKAAGTEPIEGDFC